MKRERKRRGEREGVGGKKRERMKEGEDVEWR